MSPNLALLAENGIILEQHYRCLIHNCWHLVVIFFLLYLFARLNCLSSSHWPHPKSWVNYLLTTINVCSQQVCSPTRGALLTGRSLLSSYVFNHPCSKLNPLEQYKPAHYSFNHHGLVITTSPGSQTTLLSQLNINIISITRYPIHIIIVPIRYQYHINHQVPNPHWPPQGYNRPAGSPWTANRCGNSCWYTPPCWLLNSCCW